MNNGVEAELILGLLNAHSEDVAEIIPDVKAEIEAFAVSLSIKYRNKLQLVGEEINALDYMLDTQFITLGVMGHINQFGFDTDGTIMVANTVTNILNDSISNSRDIGATGGTLQ